MSGSSYAMIGMAGMQRVRAIQLLRKQDTGKTVRERQL